MLFFFFKQRKKIQYYEKKRKIRYRVSLKVRKSERVDLSDSLTDGIAVSDSPVGI